MDERFSADALTAFFDIGDTLGSVRLSPQPPHRLEQLDVYPQVSNVLQGCAAVESSSGSDPILARKPKKM